MKHITTKIAKTPYKTLITLEKDNFHAMSY